MNRRVSFVVAVACLLALVGHIVAGHAHADVLSAASVEHHEPGDEHHDGGASCESIRAWSPAAAAGLAVGAISTFVAYVAAVLRETSVEPPVRSAPPLFLLHAALLI